jgi:hypothetical protein
MLIGKRIKQGKGITDTVAGIEEDDLVNIRIVIFLIAIKKDIATQIGKHFSDAIDKNIGMLITVIFLNILKDTIMDKREKFVTIGFISKFTCHFVGSILLFLESHIEEVLLAKIFCFKIITEYFKQIQEYGIDEMGRASQLFLELPDLPSDLIFLSCWILVDIVIVENIATLRILKLRAAKIVIQFRDRHTFHSNWDFKALTS